MQGTNSMDFLHFCEIYVLPLLANSHVPVQSHGSIYMLVFVGAHRFFFCWLSAGCFMMICKRCFHILFMHSFLFPSLPPFLPSRLPPPLLPSMKLNEVINETYGSESDFLYLFDRRKQEAFGVSNQEHRKAGITTLARIAAPIRRGPAPWFLLGYA